ncbi:transporter substrate-binding domain-containing protein [Stappia sp. GBMRC 2046]|uniref:Transporter substrate-binding domain-containing protein n=1 Tax=Stappia sediminis TaxID=2692190 RepID=A0A7X3LTT9_9HYPH|nr:transporter substrate-binding domain-containing protein [Stappia sediminis]MXN64968.1 transporter substrate-binding domain-containing protein [Stappia sediminis]
MKPILIAARHAIAGLTGALLLAMTLAGSAHADAMEDAIKRGSLRIGIAEENFLPWVGRAADGSLLGFEVDVARDLAGVLGVDADFIELPFDDLSQHLLIGDIDVIVSAYSVTSERARSVLYSIPYGETDYWLVVDKNTLPDGADEGDYDVAGYKVGVMSDSIAETIAARLFEHAEIVPLADEGAARDAFEKGELNAIIVPTPYPTYMMQRAPDRFLLGSDSLFGTSEAVAVRPDSLRFVNFIDAWIVENQASGRLAEAREYWFGSFDWMERLGESAGESDEQPAAPPEKPVEGNDGEPESEGEAN